MTELQEALPHFWHHRNAPAGALRDSCPTRGWPFAFRDQGLAWTGTSSLRLSPWGWQSPHASAQTDVGSVGRSLSSAPASAAEGAILGPRLRGLQSASHSTSALAGPATPLPPGPSLAVACPQGRLSPFAHGARPNCRRVPKTPLQGLPALTQDGRQRLTPPGAPSPDGGLPASAPPPPRELLALIQDGRPDSRIGWAARRQGGHLE